MPSSAPVRMARMSALVGGRGVFARTSSSRASAAMRSKSAAVMPKSASRWSCRAGPPARRPRRWRPAAFRALLRAGVAGAEGERHVGEALPAGREVEAEARPAAPWSAPRRGRCPTARRASGRSRGRCPGPCRPSRPRPCGRRAASGIAPPVAAVGDGPRQVARDHPDGLQRDARRPRVGPDRHVGLQRVGQRVHPVAAVTRGRQAERERRVQDRGRRQRLAWPT